MRINWKHLLAAGALLAFGPGCVTASDESSAGDVYGTDELPLGSSAWHRRLNENRVWLKGVPGGEFSHFVLSFVNSSIHHQVWVHGYKCSSTCDSPAGFVLLTDPNKTTPLVSQSHFDANNSMNIEHMLIINTSPVANHEVAETVPNVVREYRQAHLQAISGLQRGINLNELGCAYGMLTTALNLATTFIRCSEGSALCTRGVAGLPDVATNVKTYCAR